MGRSQHLKKIGKIVGFHGLKGDVKVRPSSANPDWLKTLKRVTLQLPTGETLLTISKAQLQDRMVWLRFANHPDRTSVEKYMGAELLAEEADLPPLEDGEFWVDEAVGMTVLDDVTGERIGVIKNWVTSGAQEFLEIKTDATGEIFMVPMTPHFCAAVDRENKELRLQNLDGFFESLSQSAASEKPSP